MGKKLNYRITYSFFLHDLQPSFVILLSNVRSVCFIWILVKSGLHISVYLSTGVIRKTRQPFVVFTHKDFILKSLCVNTGSFVLIFTLVTNVY